MQEWQAVVLAIQILLLAAGWLLFQRARGELSARAAETPVLSEVRALQKSVKQLVSELESAADRQAGRLEQACVDAAALLEELESQIRAAHEQLEASELRIAAATSVRPETGGKGENLSESMHRLDAQDLIVVNDRRHNQSVVQTATPEPSRAQATEAPTQSSYRERIFALADSGETAAAIARATRLSEGEVEIVLRLRGQR